MLDRPAAEPGKTIWEIPDQFNHEGGYDMPRTERGKMIPGSNSQLSNVGIVVYALYQKGGASRPVHTEDIALKAFELAPDSFSWIKYPQYPDKEVTRNALKDARKEKHGRLVTGRAGRGKGHPSRTGSERRADGWQLTEAGVKWVMTNEARLGREFQQASPRVHRQDVLAKVGQIRNHALFQEYLDKPEGFSPTLGGLGELLRCRVDAEPPIWRQRFESLRNLVV